MQLLTFDEKSDFPLIIPIMDSGEPKTDFKYQNDLLRFGVRKIINNSSHDHERYYLFT